MEASTVVVFRTWKKGRAVIALFPEIDEGRGMCLSYERVGQHGSADYTGVVSVTRPATLDEYASLAVELRSIGYKLKIKTRR